MKKQEQETIGYKGFLDDMTTKVLLDDEEPKVVSWKEGRTVRLQDKKPIELCEHGLHFCRRPEDVLTYYPPVKYGKCCKYGEVVPKGDTVESATKSASKALFVKHVFDSIWDFAETFSNSFRFVWTSLRGWCVVNPRQPTAGCMEDGEDVLLCIDNSAVKTGGAVVARSLNSSIIETSSLAVLLEGNLNIARGRCVVVRPPHLGVLYAEVTDQTGVAVIESAGYGSGFSKVYVKGVYGSTFIFLRRCLPPVIARVDNNKIMAGKYYYSEIDDKVRPMED